MEKYLVLCRTDAERIAVRNLSRLIKSDEAARDAVRSDMTHDPEVAALAEEITAVTHDLEALQLIFQEDFVWVRYWMLALVRTGTNRATMHAEKIASDQLAKTLPNYGMF